MLHSGAARRVVLISADLRLGHNVLRSIWSLGAKTYLIYDKRSADFLRLSRLCEVLHASDNMAADDPNIFLRIINEFHADRPIDAVIASDVAGLVLLAKIRDRLLPPVFPMCDCDILTMLNSKRDFHALCIATGVDVPKTLFFDNKNEIVLEKLFLLYWVYSGRLLMDRGSLKDCCAAVTQNISR